MTDIYDGSGECGEYGELDELFTSTPSIQNLSKSKKHKDKNQVLDNACRKITHKRERICIIAKQVCERRKAKFLASIKYSESLLKQNENLKHQICHLKHKLKELIVLYQRKTLKH